MELTEFADFPTQYAVLSHTWEAEEVCYQDFVDGSGQKLKGWQKIKRCCHRAAMDGWTYIWIDVCCIDKRNSAEVSEAINSMWSWYANAVMCYAYLCDVKMVNGYPVPQSELGDLFSDGLYGLLQRKAFRDLYSRFAVRDGIKLVRYNYGIISRWFTRGWTLQELLAPPHLLFLDQDWVAIGDRSQRASHIYALTSIEEMYLLGNPWALRRCSAAKKLSWAALRETTRPEDASYCLFGLLDINMSPLYGEGPLKAFHRLQVEVLQKTNDDSILAWNYPRMMETCAGAAPLAEDPLAFRWLSEASIADPIDIVRNEIDVAGSEYLMTGKGLKLSATLYKSNNKRYLARKPSTVYLMPLQCRLLQGSRLSKIALHLHKVHGQSSSYVRAVENELPLFDVAIKEGWHRLSEETIYLQEPRHQKQLHQCPVRIQLRSCRGINVQSISIGGRGGEDYGDKSFDFKVILLRAIPFQTQSKLEHCEFGVGEDENEYRAENEIVDHVISETEHRTDKDDIYLAVRSNGGDKRLLGVVHLQRVGMNVSLRLGPLVEIGEYHTMTSFQFPFNPIPTPQEKQIIRHWDTLQIPNHNGVQSAKTCLTAALSPKIYQQSNSALEKKMFELNINWHLPLRQKHLVPLMLLPEDRDDSKFEHLMYRRILESACHLGGDMKYIGKEYIV